MSEYDSKIDTLTHINRVRHFLNTTIEHMQDRVENHDKSKLSEPEKSVFDRVTPRLKGLTYGSPEYKASLAEMGEALKHHYANNRHHPEHFTPVECVCCFANVSTFKDGRCQQCGNGATGSPLPTLKGMTLVDLVEMFCDWCAATERHADGDIQKSITLNKERFQFGDVLESIFRNTAREFGMGKRTEDA
jgi:hypothetical protein